MLNRITATSKWVGILVGLTMMLAMSVLSVQAAEPGNNNGNSPQEPSGTPDSSFVKDIQSLFNTGKPAVPATPTAQPGASRSMTVQGITPAPSTVSIWAEKSTYRNGDKVQMFLRLPRAAYVYILNIDTAGEIRLVFPNPYDTSASFNGSGTFSLPRNSRYTYPVAGRPGTEYLMLIAASEPITIFDHIARQGGDFPLVDDPGAVVSMFKDWVSHTSAWSAFAWNSYRLEDNYGWPSMRNKAPVAKIEASSTRITAGSSVSFSSNGSYDSDGAIRTFQWDLNGDGRVDATGSSAKMTYNTAGTYTAKLTVQDNQGATTSTTVQIVVEAPKTLLEISCNPKDLAIYVDGSYLGRGSVKQYVSPGTHEVKISYNGQVFTTMVTVAPGMRSAKVEVSF